MVTNVIIVIIGRVWVLWVVIYFTSVRKVVQVLLHFAHVLRKKYLMVEMRHFWDSAEYFLRYITLPRLKTL